MSTDPFIESIGLLLDASEATELTVGLWSSGKPQNYIPHTQVTSFQVAVAKDSQQWVKAALSCHPETAQNAFIILRSNQALSDNHTRHHVHLFPEAVTTTAGLCSKRFWSGPLSVLYPSRHSSYSRLYQIPIAGKHAVNLGRSPILGKPVSHMLLNRNATVTICHSKTNNLPLIIGIADIVVAAVGKPAFIQGAWMKEGAVVLDAGYNAGNIGDVEFSACHEKASAITPVPAGIGPVTIAMLLKHTVLAAEKSKFTT